MRVGADAPVGLGGKLILGSGDHALTITIGALSLFYFVFLTQQVGMEPLAAGAVPMVGKLVDAITDPWMGRISDMTRSRWGRRRPYFALGAIPFALSFALLWVDPGFESSVAQFAFFSGVFIFYSVCSTIVGVPYVAILPEVVPDFDQRTSVNAYRSALTLAGTLLAALAFRPLAAAMGDGDLDYFGASLVLGVWLILPWAALFWVVRERPEFQEQQRVGLVDTVRALGTHADYLRVLGMYVFGRIAMDLLGAVLLLYLQFWLGRGDDFELMMALFMGAAVAMIPFWTRLAARTDKRRSFALGCAWWGTSMLLFAFVTPGFPPPWLLFVLVALAGGGYSAVDMMVWSMLADVVDEDELRTGQRREGQYGGVFLFARKLGNAGALLLVGVVLQIAGFEEGATEQSEAGRQAVRWLTALGPVFFLALAAWLVRSYSLTRERHAAILAELERRR